MMQMKGVSQFPNKAMAKRWKRALKEDYPTKDFYLPDDGESFKREYPGLRKPLRMAIVGEAYGQRDPFLICHQDPPPEFMQLAMEETFAGWTHFEDGTPRMKLAKHPHTGEWCLYQCVNRALNQWRQFFRAREPAFNGYEVPAEFLDDPIKVAYGKFLGKAYEPARDIFEMIEGANVAKYGVLGVDAWDQQLYDKSEAYLEDRMAQFESDMFDYDFNRECDAANQRAGSGFKMRSFPFEMELQKAHQRVEKWVIERVFDKEGKLMYEKRRRRSVVEVREALIAEMIKKLELELEQLNALEEARGLQRSLKINVDKQTLEVDREALARRKEQLKQALREQMLNGMITVDENGVTVDHEMAERIAAKRAAAQALSEG